MVGEVSGADTCLAVIDPLTATVEEANGNRIIQSVSNSDWCSYTLRSNSNYNINENDARDATIIVFNTTTMLYPRIQINSLNLRTDNDEILVKYNDNNLVNYEDY